MCVCVCVCVRVCVCVCVLASNRLHPNCSAGDRLGLILSLWSNGSRLKSLAHIAGWKFVLQRCTRAVGMDIDLGGDTEGAKELMDRVTMRITSGSQHGPSKAFTSLKELRIRWRSRTGCDAQLASHMALMGVAAACHGLEVRARRSGFYVPAHWLSSVQAIIA